MYIVTYSDQKHNKTVIKYLYGMLHPEGLEEIEHQIGKLIEQKKINIILDLQEVIMACVVTAPKIIKIEQDLSQEGGTLQIALNSNNKKVIEDLFEKTRLKPKYHSEIPSITIISTT